MTKNMKYLILAVILSGCATAPVRTFTEVRTPQSAAKERDLRARFENCVKADEGRFYQICRMESYYACHAVGLSGNCAQDYR